MKEYDFVFVYEVKNRELENICLLRYELERRGYRVAFVETWDQEFHRTRPLRTKVVIGFALYNDDTVKFISSKVCGCNKIVNLQWEQIFANGELRKAVQTVEGSCNFGVHGLAKKAVHISWGENNYRMLTDLYNLKSNQVRVTGHIGLDLLRPELQGYYFTREELLSQYNIDSGKRVCLFISSLSYATFPEEQLRSNPLYENMGFDIAKHVDISKETQSTLVTWFEKLLGDRDDCVIIYRPHPAERHSSLLLEAMERYPNFRVIEDLSVKQWILAADNIWLWWSTSISEVYAAKKSCIVLRPVEIPYDMELTLYNNVNTITSYEAFVDTIDNENPFPIPVERFCDYYSIDDDIPAYKKACDLLEAVYLDDSYDMELPNKPTSFGKRLRFNIRNWLRPKIVSFPQFAQTKLGKQLFLWKYPQRAGDYNTILDDYKYRMTMREHNHLSKKEVSSIMNRIHHTITNYDEAVHYNE